MNLVDIIIIVLLLIYVLKGFSNGLIKELVTFIGGFAVLIIAFLLKNPLSVFLYERLPFFKFGGLFEGVSVLNIIVYELLSFVIVATFLMVLYKLIFTVTNILDKIIKLIFILDIPSKIFGAVIGFIEGVAVTFIILFISAQFAYPREYINESKYGNMIITKTPILASAAKPIYNSLNEIYEVAESYKDSTNKNEVNLHALDTLLKYKVLDIENARKLVEENKLNIENVETVLNKY